MPLSSPSVVSVVSLGKSIHQSHFYKLLSNATLSHQENASPPNRSDFKLGKSIRHFILSQSLFNSSDANKKLQLSLFSFPISITSKEGTFSISHIS